jgi:hypothetical protein
MRVGELLFWALLVALFLQGALIIGIGVWERLQKIKR